MSSRERKCFRAVVAAGLVFSMLLPNTTLALQEAIPLIDETQQGPAPVPAPVAEAVEESPAEEEDTRTLEELVDAGFIRLDEDDNIIMVQVSDESGISTETAMQLLGGAQNYAAFPSTGESANRRVFKGTGVDGGGGGGRR